MPELSRYDTLSQVPGHMTAQRKSSNSSEDPLRKISNDSGIGIGGSRLPPNYNELIGEPRLASADLSAAMLLAQQQSLTAAAALNPAMLSLMSAGLGGLFANPLATAMLQQEASAARRLISGSAGAKTTPAAPVGPGKSYPKEQLPVYPGFAGLVQPGNQVADQLALSEALRGQLLNRKLSDDLEGAGTVTKPTRKAHSFSGTSSSPMNQPQQFSPPTSTSPNLSHNLSPHHGTANSGDEQQPSPYRDDDSGESAKSSIRSRTPQPVSLDTQQSSVPYNHPADLTISTPLLNTHQFHPSSRKRKNGIIAGMPLPDLSGYGLGGAQPSNTGDIPMHKLSTASLPANLPSTTPRHSLVHDPLASLSNRGSPATSRKRSRNLDEKCGARRDDESYWERRRKNNEAAKRSRDSRRAKEDEIAIRAAFLEQENFKLKLELNKVKEEYCKLQAEVEKKKLSPAKESAGSSEVTESSSGAVAECKPTVTTASAPAS